MTNDEMKARRVYICDPAHPHFNESGYLLGNSILLLGKPMTEVRLEDCRHGTDGCFVSKGQISLERRGPERVR